jgi:hypothetical protein
MTALFVDALLGYEYFVEKGGKVTRDEINHYLTSKGRRRIQHRTYTHYKKLIENGFRTYVPINKFDVFQSLGKLQMAADRRRYHREKRIDPVEISRDGKDWILASITDISLVGYGIVSPRFPVAPGTKIWVRYKGYTNIPVIVVWRKHDGRYTRLGLRALEFIAGYRKPESDIQVVRPVGYLYITRADEGDISWINLYRVLSTSNELIVAVSDLIYAVADQLNTDIRLASPVVESIHFGSSGRLELKIDLGIADVLRSLLEWVKFIAVGKKHYLAEVRGVELENEGKWLDNREKAIDLYVYKDKKAQESESRQLDLDIKRIETIRSAVKTLEEVNQSNLPEYIVNEVETAILDVIKEDKLPEGIFDHGNVPRGILEKRVLPPLAELVAGDDPGFNIETSTQASDEIDTDVD